MKKITKKKKTGKIFIITLLVSGFAATALLFFIADKAIGKAADKGSSSSQDKWDSIVRFARSTGDQIKYDDDGKSYTVSFGNQKDDNGTYRQTVDIDVATPASNGDDDPFQSFQMTITSPQTDSQADPYIVAKTTWGNDDVQDRVSFDSGRISIIDYNRDGSTTSFDRDPKNNYQTGWHQYPNGDIDGAISYDDGFYAAFFISQVPMNDGTTVVRKDTFFRDADDMLLYSAVWDNGVLVSRTYYKTDGTVDRTDYFQDSKTSSDKVTYSTPSQGDVQSNDIVGGGIGSGYIPPSGPVTQDTNSDNAIIGGGVGYSSNSSAVTLINGNVSYSNVSYSSSDGSPVFTSAGQAVIGDLDFGGDISADDMYFLLGGGIGGDF